MAMKKIIPILLALLLLAGCKIDAEIWPDTIVDIPVDPTEAVTEETTAAPTTEPETTFDLDLEETEEAEPVELPESKSWIGLALIAGVLFFILLGAIIFKLSSRRGGRYRRRR